MLIQKIELSKYIEDILENDETINTTLMALKHKYNSVYKHCINVCYSVFLLSKAIKLDKSQSLRIALGGLLHDVGKINISPKILYKQSSLNAREQLIMERHPILGANIINNSKNKENVYRSVLYHHERYDGKGYCKGLQGKNIPLEARIISICDSFDAMVSYRSYRDALSLEQAKEELIRNKDTQFDGELVDHFLQVVDDFYYEQYTLHQPLDIKNDSQVEGKADAINWKPILDQLPDIGIMKVDQYNTIQFCNKFAARIRNKEQREVTEINFLNLHRKHRKNIMEKKLLKIKNGEINGWERLMAIQGKYIENKYIRISNEKGEYDGFLLLTTDVTEKEKLLRLLETNIEKLNILVQANNLISDSYDLKEIYIKTVELISKVIKIEFMDIFIRNYKGIRFYHVGNIDDFDQDVRKYIKQENISRMYDMNNRISMKELKDKRLIGIPLRFKNNNSGIMYIQTTKEVTIHTKEEELLQAIVNYTNSAMQNHLLYCEIEERAIKDNLTGVYNRQYFQNVVQSLENSNNKFAFAMIDIDRLKFINDHFGHLYGDLIIKETANILKKSIRKTDFIFRYGGDEFLIIMNHCNEEDVKNIFKRIRNKVCSWKSPESELELSLSFGYCMSGQRKSITELIILADENMYKNKNKRKKMRRMEHSELRN